MSGRKQVLGFAILILLAWAVYAVLPENLAALSALKAVFNPARQAPPAGSCALNWLRLGRLPASEASAAYRAALDCGTTYLKMAQFARPLDANLAAYAVERYPASATAWLWWANNLKDTDRLAALKAFQVTVSLDPSIALAWCESGRIYEIQKQFDLARDSYYHCCSTGDTGSQGCYGAGRMEEKLGNPQAAIAAYLRSKYIRSLNRAKELEKEAGTP
jgi:tetratricopeptide (TPR) repeat protein